MTRLRGLSQVSSYIFIFLMLAVPLGFTYYAWNLTSTNLEEKTRAKFAALAKESEKALLYRMESYKQALLGGKGFLEGSTHVTRSEWVSYVGAVDVLQNFPGINGIGLIEDVDPDTVEEFRQGVILDGIPKFRIHPEGDHPAIFIIRYIEPLNINRQALGLNIAFEANRYEAAIKSRDSGKPAITRRILLVQDAEKTPGFLLLLPTYATGMPNATVAARRAAFKGWVYAPFIGRNFLSDLTSSQGRTMRLRVYDGARQADDALIYDSNPAETEKTTPKFMVRHEIEIMQQKWLLVWSSTDAFDRQESSNQPFLILIVGLLFTGSCAVFLTVMTISAGDELSSQGTSYFIPVMAFGFAAMAAFYTHTEVSRREGEFIRNVTQKEAEIFRDMIRSHVVSRIDALTRMAQRWNTRGGTPMEEWRADAEAYIRDQSGLRAVEWVDNTFHVRWVVPLKGNERAVGLNIVFDEQREKALKGAAEKDGVTVTPPLKLVQGYTGIISYAPLRVAGRFDGFIVGLLDIEQIVSDTMPRAYGGDFVLRVSSGGKTFYESAPLAAPRIGELVHQETIKIHDQEWTLTVFPTANFIRNNSSFLPDLILAIGLVLAIMIAVLINFAQRTKQKTTLVAEKENLLSTFVKHTPAAVAMFDKDVRYIAASDRWFKDYGLNESTVIGKSHYDVFPEIRKRHPEWLDLHRSAIEGEIIKRDEEVFQRDDGREVWLRYELRPWYKGHGESGGLIMFTEDITERKQMDTMKDEFISTVNHELRTPLTSIQGALGLLRAKLAGKLDDKGEKLLSISYENSVRLSFLVNDILDMEKIAVGKMSFDLESVEMDRLVRTIVEQNQSYADEWNVRYELRPMPGGVYCQIDQNRFNQALTNLLSNAAKFSNEGDVVTIGMSIAANRQLRISVADRGPGIPTAFQSKVFEKFAQADGSSTRTKGGTGLGLSITNSIIEAFGGTVTFDSEEGQGTTFRIELPIFAVSRDREAV